MSTTNAFSADVPPGFQTPNHKARQVRFARLLLIISLIFPLAAPADKPPGTAVEKSLPPAQILPISLGAPAECFGTEGTGLNNGASAGDLVVTAMTSGCTSQYNRPYRWQGGFWDDLGTLPGATGGIPKGVSNDGTVVGWLAGSVGQAFVTEGGGAMASLPLLDGMIHASAYDISADGTHIFGTNGTATDSPSVRWNRSGSGWIAEKIGDGIPTGSTDDGSVMVGNWAHDKWAFVWMEGGSQQDLGADSSAFDISPTGTMIVGARETDCPNKPDCRYPVPVYWVVENGQWTMHDLQALDGVDSVANGVAEVDGQLVIVGYGFTNQDGGILRPVAWIPAADGSYGAPLRLEARGGYFESWAEAVDINSNGVVLGWSDSFRWVPDGTYPPPVAVLWNLFGQFDQFHINAGLNDAWKNPATPGQGFFVNVFPDIGQVFLAWFTYDTTRPAGSATASIGEPGHRWLTAFGPYTGNQAVLDVEITEGGVFNAANPAPTHHPDGTVILEFSNCSAGTVTYDIPSIGRQGVIPIQRVSSDNTPACEALAGASSAGTTTAVKTASKVASRAVNSPAATGSLINRGLNDAWKNPATPGQGFFLNVFPGLGKMFLAWFTYDTTRPPGSVHASLADPGHRWLTAFGSYSGNQAVLDIEVTQGGVFDSASPVPTHTGGGTVTVDMTDCENGTVTYDIASANLHGEIPIQRLALDNVPLCQSLAAQEPHASIDVGDMTVCAVGVDGKAWCWGMNNYGQLGTGDTAQGNVPRRAAEGYTFKKVSVSTGGAYTCGITTTGQAYCWGLQEGGRLGNGTMAGGIVFAPVPVSGGHTFTDIAAGGDHACAIATGGAAYCWGHNEHGQHGTGNNLNSAVPAAVTGGLSFTSITTHQMVTCGIAADGAGYCWGNPGMHNLGSLSSNLSKGPVQIAGGLKFSSLQLGVWTACGVTTDGDGYCWGYNGSGELGIGSKIPEESVEPLKVVGGHKWKSISPGVAVTCGVATDGGGFCWGGNAWGERGDGPFPSPDVTSPVPVAGNLVFQSIDADWVTCGVASEIFYCWGPGKEGAIGDGAQVNRGIPTRVAGQP